jgi:hypothetical protein
MSSPVEPVAPADNTRLAPGNYTATGVLNRVFSLIGTVLTSMQSVAAAQASRLTFLSSWQTAYSDMMNQVHTFVASNGDGISDPSSTSDTNLRSDLNKLNSSLIQQMQNNQSIISDDAKALQSNVSQSNDAVNQQATLGTSILQDMNTLLSTMFSSSS